MTRKDDVAQGMRFQQRDFQAFVWEVSRLFDAIDGRRYAVLRRVDSPSDQKTLAINGLRDSGLFKRIESPRAEPPQTVGTGAG